jgi:CBS domain-containing protein
MREHDIGDVVVTDDGEVVGIVTDRDITVWAPANGADPVNTTHAVEAHRLIWMSSGPWSVRPSRM